ncbi:PIN domain-containing protein [Cyanobacterium aponinum UTEX 3221]|uniref:PilT protein domain protein n=1 Tax=Cyanobacterium aponinum (strain PCC 10605) TaxID=755178 RepID=K9Z3B2_CYAAP|nr:PIN domain-containing protein [Cyanobacterium aponinum]AFZ53644.1 PilT protein domain protein [Cyanobacterium aponinum PCC 10605]WRL38065.1 PIN domain-containing protein [Cyanobacterium aponinum UTEX 3221]
MITYVVDTHALAWFISEDERLSCKAKEILTQAENGEVKVLIPTLVMAELTHIAEKGKVKIIIEELLDKINQGDGFSIVGFDFVIFQQMLILPKHWDIHDRIIAATASYYQSTLITRDQILGNFPNLKTIWE